MLSTGKKVREGKRMSATGAAIRDGEPSETAAARDVAGTAVQTDFTPAGRTGRPRRAPPPEGPAGGAAQHRVAGARRNHLADDPEPTPQADPLGDLEWLVMPAVLLQKFRLSTTASSRSAWCCGHRRTRLPRCGSTRETNGCPGGVEERDTEPDCGCGCAVWGRSRDEKPNRNVADN